MSEAPIRSRILDEARELFVAQGAAAVTMRGVAARVGVTPMALYRYFASREELLAQSGLDAAGIKAAILKRFGEIVAAGPRPLAGSSGS